MILLACLLYFLTTLLMLPVLQKGYHKMFKTYSSTKWGLWCVACGFFTYFIFGMIAKYVITPELAREYLYLFIIIIFIAITVYNNIVSKDSDDENENGQE